MADFPDGTGSADSGAWVRNALAGTFGEIPAGGLAGAPEEGRRLLARLENAYEIRRDDLDGSIAVLPVRGASAFVDGGAANPAITETARGFLEPAKAAILAIDPALCVPGACADEVGCAIRQITATIDLLISGSPRADSVHLTRQLLHDVRDGSLARLEILLRGSPVGGTAPAERNLAAARALQAIRLAGRALEGFRTAYEEIAPGADDWPAQQISVIVRRCVPQIQVQIRALRGAFAACGVTDYEMGLLVVWESAQFGPLVLTEALQILEAEPARWLTLIEQDHCDLVETIQTSASRIQDIALGFGDSAADLPLLLLAPLGLPHETQIRLTDRIKRLRAFLMVVSGEILNATEPAPPANDDSVSTPHEGGN